MCAVSTKYQILLHIPETLIQKKKNTKIVKVVNGKKESKVTIF